MEDGVDFSTDKNMVEKLLFLYFLLLPFQFALSPMEGFDVALSRVAALGIGVLFLLERFRNGSWKLPKWEGLFPMMGFLLLALFSALGALEPAWSVRKALFFLSFIPLWFVAVDTLSRGGRRMAERISLGFFFGAVSMAALALLQFLSQFVFSLDQILTVWLSRIYPIFLGETFSQSIATYPSLLVNIGGETILRATGVFPDPHVAAFYFGMALPFGLWFALFAKEGKRSLFLCGSLILFLADLCTFSRGGYVGLFGMILFFGAFSLYHYRKSMSSAWMKRICFGIVGVLLLGVSISPVRERLADTFSMTDGSNKARIALWQEASERIAMRSWLGYGLGNYPLAVKPSAEYREPIYIHNLYLDIWAELGIVGLLFFLLIFLFPVIKFFFSGRFSDAAFPAALAMILFLNHSLFENTLFSVHIFPAILLFIAVLSCHNERIESVSILTASVKKQ